jgi:hypothetical protein
MRLRISISVDNNYRVFVRTVMKALQLLLKLTKEELDEHELLMDETSGSGKSVSVDIGQKLLNYLLSLGYIRSNDRSKLVDVHNEDNTYGLVLDFTGGLCRLHFWSL